ncbi:MAG: MarR family winged helix-turn-helix transcriptional regulator [Burkholderiaceae bacterium]
MSTSSSSDYKFSEQIGHLLRRAYQRHTAIFQEVVSDSQLTAAQFVVLCCVRDNGSCQVGEIVRATAIDEASVRGIVERLKWRELLAVAHQPGDTRHMLVSLTPAGRDMIEQTVPFARQISERTFGELDAAEREAIVSLLRKISGIDANPAS